MAYTPREIKDRVAVGDDIFLVEDLGDNRIRLIPAPTHVSEAGTPVNKALLQHMENHLVPPGGIIMWSGAINDIPVGWALCDGSNGTPDLRDRFIVGAGGAYNPGNTGGAQSVALTVAQMPQHNHSASSDSAGGHEHNVEFVGSFGSPPEVPQFNRVLMGRNNSVLRRATESDSGTPVYGIGGDAVLNIPRIDIDISGNHQHNITVNNSGSGDPHENRPPYYALAYIMKL